MSEKIKIEVPKIQSSTLKTAMKRALEGKFDRNTVTVGNYTVNMVYDGYSVMMNFYFKGRHYANWDSLRKEIEFYHEKDLKFVANTINAICRLGYKLEIVEQENKEIVFENWKDFKCERDRD